MEPLPSAIRSNPVQACISREDEHPGPKEQAAEIPSEGHMVTHASTRMVPMVRAFTGSLRWVLTMARRDPGWRFGLGDDARTAMACGMLRPQASSTMRMYQQQSGRHVGERRRRIRRQDGARPAVTEKK